MKQTNTKPRTFRDAARAPLMRLDQHGHLYVTNLMHLFQCSRQTIYSRLAQGVIPPPDGRDGLRPYWNTQTLRPYFE